MTTPRPPFPVSTPRCRETGNADPAPPFPVSLPRGTETRNARNRHRYNVRTEWRAREYSGDVVTGVQLRSHGQSVWLRAEELRRVAQELLRLADDHAAASNREEHRP